MNKINNMVGLLVNRQFLIDYETMQKISPRPISHVNWYSALQFLNHYKSVAHSEWTNTCSSAGDWDGFLIQRIKNTNYLIPINQENRCWHGGGYDLYTGAVLASWQGKLDYQEAKDIYSNCIEEFL